MQNGIISYPFSMEIASYDRCFAAADARQEYSGVDTIAFRPDSIVLRAVGRVTHTSMYKRRSCFTSRMSA